MDVRVKQKTSARMRDADAVELHRTTALDETLEHLCPWCKRKRVAPIAVVAHPLDGYHVTCGECSKTYKYSYLSGAWR